MMVLVWLQNKQVCSAGKISSCLGLSPSKTSRSLKELTSSELIYEQLDKRDLRKCNFRISSKGTGVVEELRETFGTGSIDEHLRYFAESKLCALRIGQMTGHKLTNTSHKLLLALSSTSLTVSQLCKTTFLAQTTTSMALRSLQNHGLVKQDRPQDGDMRKRIYTITAAGHDIAATMLASLRN